MRALSSLTCLTGILAIFMLAAPTFAAKGEHNGPAAQLQSVVSQLNLSTEQQSQIDTAISNLQSKLKDLHKQAKTASDADKASLKQQAKDAMHDTVEKITQNLNKDQRVKFRQLMAEAKAAHKAEHKSTTQPAEQT